MHNAGTQSSPVSSPSTHNRSSVPKNSRMAVGSFVDEYTNRIQILGFGNDQFGYVATASRFFVFSAHAPRAFH